MKIGIIEDNDLLAKSLSKFLTGYGECIIASNYLEGLKLINQQEVTLCLVDIHLNYNFAGLELIRKCKQLNIQAIAMSGDNSEDVVEKAYLAGGVHFLNKDYILDELSSYFKNLQLESKGYFTTLFSEKFFTTDQTLQKNIKQLFTVASKEKSIFISGPSGIGKTSLALELHQFLNPQSPIVHINCAEIPENLIESELFGHVKGAFTGADKNYKGKILTAHGSTLFLDEIGTLSLNLQSKLLKVLETKTFNPVGSNETLRSDFFLISATCDNLAKKILKGLFREDLYYRIVNLHLNIPPLAERHADLEALIVTYTKQSPRRFYLKPEAKKILLNYSWPGNYRELKKILFHLSQTKGGIVSSNEVQSLLEQSSVKANNANINGNTITNINNDILYEQAKKLGLKNFISLIEQQIILHSMKLNNYQVNETIKTLKLSPSSFYRIYKDNSALEQI